MVTGTPEQANEFWLDSPTFGKKRVCNGPYDFGDQATVGKCLKRVGKSICDFADGDFGTYLGKYGDKYVVLQKTIMYGVFGCEIFDSLDELKQSWQLD